MEWSGSEIEESDVAVLRAQLVGDFFDVDAAIHRPGSWEWPTSQAEAMRDYLQAQGYEAHVHPLGPWRRVWRKP